MVGEVKKQCSVEDVLTDNQVSLIVKKCVGETAGWQLVGQELAPAAEGMAGFLGDHFRLTLTVKLGDSLVKIPLVSPVGRQGVPVQLVRAGDARPVPLGYSTHDQFVILGAEHSRVALAAVARFHAAVADHEARRSRALARPYSLMEEHGHLIVENNFRDTPWIAAGPNSPPISSNTSPISTGTLFPIWKFLAACNDVSERKDTLNVLIHKDLWANNIMFKHEAGVPTNAILVDFQCLRYAPPAFDVMLCWYCTTDRSFRERYEREMLQHYFDTFISTVNEVTKEKLKGLGYDYEEYLRWVEECRRFGLLVSIMLYPYILLDQVTAREMFDNPETFLKHTNEDRSEPVLEYARRSDGYRTRQLEVCEDFVERYLKA
ncbi:hypothetical protein MSG28_013988 [Choristoneura fumiferana]|uniref:Uncharacterized protein n=1 Tax=Choristoneura fumiferana TaxID=7141 RepID=A0ACC0KAQ6_CHOFU|nr:hypothetical protein MSG28_013988 [Choristoneura fumiferana]